MLFTNRITSLLLHPVKKRILIAVSNDASTDQRVYKQSVALHASGFDIKLYCRKVPGKHYEADPFPTRRFRLPIHSGVLFYAAFNIRLFFALLFAKGDMLYANDLDTLPANALISAIRQKPLIYDSHEYFTGVPEIQKRPFVKFIWGFLERNCISRAKLVLTVSESIAALLMKNYSLPAVSVVRNVPIGNFEPVPFKRAEIGIDSKTFLIVLQGAGINVDRGGEELLEALQFIEDATLMIIGGGDAMPLLRKKGKELKLESKIIFIPKLPYADMMRYTAMADLGVSLDKASNINYRFSLPNKLFDYALAGIPVLTSNLIEVRKIVEKYEIGAVVASHNPKDIAEAIHSLRANPELLTKYKRNTSRMNEVLNWESEFEPVIDKIKKFV